MFRGSKECISHKLKHHFEGVHPLGYVGKALFQSGSGELFGIKHFFPGKLLRSQNTSCHTPLVDVTSHVSGCPTTACWTSRLMHSLKSNGQVRERSALRMLVSELALDSWMVQGFDIHFLISYCFFPLRNTLFYPAS